MSNAIESRSCPKCGAGIPADAPQELCPRCLLREASIPTEAGNTRPPPAPPSREAVAVAFPQLEILELIGQGGMGFVFKARQTKLGRLVALKILPWSDADPSFAERFTREGRVLARLNHPNIVTIHDFGRADGFFYLLMEYVDGVNLRQAMRAGRFTPGEALAIIPRICEALQYAHEEGILHRDIKPENILLDSRGRVKIADFGIAKLIGESLLDPTLTGTGARLGTPHYMAPEQIEKPSDVDHRADIYSLGVVFYELLTGELPLGRFAPPSAKSRVDPQIDEIVLRTLAKERELRQQSAGEVKTEVETAALNRAQLIRSRPATVHPVAAQPETPGWMVRAAILFLVYGVLSLLPTLRLLGNSTVLVWSNGTIVAVTGLALLAGGTVARNVALACNAVALAMSGLSVISLVMFLPTRLSTGGGGLLSGWRFGGFGLLLDLAVILGAIAVLCRPGVVDFFRQRDAAAAAFPGSTAWPRALFWVGASVVMFPAAGWVYQIVVQSLRAWWFMSH